MTPQIEFRASSAWPSVGNLDAILSETSATSYTVSSLTSRDSSCIMQMNEFGCVGGRVRGTSISVCSDIC